MNRRTLQHCDFQRRRTVGVSGLPRAGSVFVDDFDMIAKRNHVVEQTVSVNG